MSADLLAAFGAPGETASSTRNSQSRAPLFAKEGQDKTLICYCNQSVLAEQTRVDVRHSQPHEPTSRDPNVLFDALEDEAELDEYGDFEVADEALSSKPYHSPQQSADLLGLGEIVSTVASTMPTADVARTEAAYEILAIEPVENTPDDEWGDFEDARKGRETAPASKDTSQPGQRGRDEWTDEECEHWAEFEDADDIKINQMSPPIAMRNPLQQQTQPAPVTPLRSMMPTNIPPPSRLLQLLPKIVDELALKCATLQPASRIAEEIDRTYVSSSRIIAGRSWRWKRDRFLSQSMSIGPASSTASRGMKLQSVNKNESVKEEQELVEVVRTWAKYTHRFDMVLSRAAKPRHVHLSATTGPKKVTGPKYLSAGHACALCGLLRNERLVGTDGSADDLFGEYWTEYWGHTACMNFWQAHEERFRDI